MRDTGTPYDQRHANVRVIRRLLAWLQTMLADVVPVVRREDEISVVECARAAQRVEEMPDHLVDALHRLHPTAIFGIERSDVGGRQGRLRGQPFRLALTPRVE